MPNTTVPLRSTEEVARTVGNNIQTVLAERGRNMDWLANEMDVSVFTILKAFSECVPMWLVFDAAYYLDVPADRLIGARS